MYNKQNHNIWLGNGQTITGKLGTFWNLTINLTELGKNPQIIKEINTKDGVQKIVDIQMGKRQNPLPTKGQFPIDMYLKWNSFEPEKTVEDKEGSNLPF